MRLEDTNVLLVEDNRRMADLVRAVLGGLGIGCAVHAESAAEAMTALDSGRFDIVLLDRRLKGEDGLDLARGIRRHRNRRIARIGLIMLTADAEERSVREAMGAGVDAYLVKPFAVAAVRDRILAALQLYEARLNTTSSRSRRPVGAPLVARL